MLKTETDDEYHGGEGVSKSTLWTLWSKTPFHARFCKPKETAALDTGKAAHIAILEPETFEARVMKGPEARGNSNEWKHAVDHANYAGCILLKPDAYDLALMIRDLAASLPVLDIVRSGRTIVETSAYHADEETGVLLKTRPDNYSVDHRLIVDIKNMADASWRGFQRSVGSFGYHMQHAHYSDVWSKGSGHAVDGFFFVVFEKSDPPTVAVYELAPSAIREGHAVYRAAVQQWAECEKSGEWPGYPVEVAKIALRSYDHRLTPAPNPGEDDGEEPADAEEENIPQ